LPNTALSSGESAYRLVGIGLAIVGVIGFALRPLFIRAAYTYTADPVTLLALRMIFSLPFFIVIAAWPRRGGSGARLTGRDHIAIIMLGFIGYYAASFLDFLGLQYVSAGLGRLLLFLYPTIVLLLSAAFLGKRILRREVMALALSYAGLALVLSTALDETNSDLPLGSALVLAGAVFYAVYLVAGSQVVKRVGSMRFTAYSMAISSIPAVVQFLLLEPAGALELPAAVWGYAAVLATFSTVLPVFLQAEALKRIGANHFALIGAVGPVSVAATSALGLDEPFTWVQAVGGLLVISGVLLVSVKRS
jgi:drug/metabolite transporter (DMT)-like permease